MPKDLPGDVTGTTTEEEVRRRVDPQAAIMSAQNTQASQQAEIAKRVDPQALSINLNGPNTEYHIYKAGLAGKLDISNVRTNEMFKQLDPATLYQMPFTIAQTTSANQDEGRTQAVNDSVVWMSTLYGNEALGSLVASALIQDPTSRARTQAVIFDLAGMTAQAAPQTTLGVAPQTLADTGVDVQAALDAVTHSSDPTAALRDLDPNTQSAVISLAQQFTDTIDAAGTPLTDQFGRVVLVAKNGYRAVLAPDEIAVLRQYVAQAAGGLGGTTESNLGSAADVLGIAQIKHQGGGVLVLDKDWARAHPDDALAEKLFLEEQYPEAHIVIGEQGILGSILDKFGLAIDYATAPLGAAVHQVTSELNKFGSGNRDNTLEAVDAARLSMQRGEVPPWVRSLMKQTGENPDDPQAVDLFLQHIENQNTLDVGVGGMFEDLRANTRPQMLGFGFADNVTKSMDLLPGDPEYDYAHTAIGIVTQFAFDPAMWAPAVIGGLRDAGVLARVLGDVGGIPKTIDAITGAENVLKVSNSAIHQYVYSRLARTAEETLQTKTFINGANRFYAAREAAGSEAAFTTYLNMVGADLEEARRMSSFTTSKEGAAIALMDDALGAGAVPTLERRYHITDKLDEVKASLRPKPSELPTADLASMGVGGARPGGVVENLPPEHFMDLEGSVAHHQSVIRDTGTVESPVVIRVAEDGTQTVTDGVKRIEAARREGLERLPVRYEYDADQVKLLADKHYYESILEGHQAIREADAGFMGGKQIRRLEKLAGLRPNRWDQAVDAIGHSIAEFPANIIVSNSDRLRAIEQASPGAAPALQAMYAKLGHIWRNTGYSTRFVLEDTIAAGAPAVQKAQEALRVAEASGDKVKMAAARLELNDSLTDLVNTPNASLENLHAIATENGLSDQRYAQLVEPYVSGQLKGDRVAQYQWYKDTWDTIHEESRTLDGLGKKGMRNLYETHYEDRLGGRVTVRGTGGDINTEAVWTRQLPGVKPYGIPTLDADLIRSIQLPSVGQYRSYATATGRTMKAWAAGGDVRKAISLAHGGLARGWRTVTSAWRSLILGSRLFGALPLRIIGEQQLRMAAFDYSSAVWHPVEWFGSTNWGAHYFVDDAHLWDAAGSPVHALGTMVDDMRGRVAPLNKGELTLGSGVADEETAFFRAYSAYLNKFSVSPSVGRWRLAGGEIQTPDEVARLMQFDTTPLGDTWRGQMELTRGIDDARTSEEVATAARQRWDVEMRQLIGDDPEGIIKQLVYHKTTMIDGKPYTVGTPELAKKLEQLVADRRWTPGMEKLPSRMGEYLPGDKVSLMGEFTQNLFKMFYSRPDLATSRVPLYRQIFKRNYDNFVKLGYDENRAIEVARSLAAEKTADLLFQLGSHTSGEYLLREIMPFFPAYRELATTWIGRIPARIGELQDSHLASVGWVLGAGALTERANLVLKTAKELGIVDENADGSLYVNVPLFGNILQWMTFGKVDFNSHVPLESLAGVLPVPFNLSGTDDQGKPLPLSQRLVGMLPTIGGTAVPILALLKGAAPSFFGPLEDWLTPFGSDQSLGIPLIDQIWEGVSGEPSPFTLGKSRTLHEAAIHSAMVDGFRLAMYENPAPTLPDNPTNAQSEAYQKEWLAWQKDIIAKGEDYQQHLYLLKSGLGMVLPFSISYTDEYKADIATMWDMLNANPGGSDSRVASAELKLFLDRNPGLQPWMVAKFTDERLQDHPNEGVQAFYDAIAAKEITIPDANTWVTYAAATTSYSEHMARVAEIKSRAGKTWQEVLMNFDNKGELTQEHDNWEAFLDWNHNHMADLGVPDVRSMLDVVNQRRAIRAGDEPLITLDQQRLIDFDQSMRHYAAYFDLDPAKAGKYSEMRGAAYDALFNSIGAPSEISKGISQWFDKTADPYYTSLDKLYGRIDTAKPKDVELLYSEIRKLSDHYDAKAAKTGDPTPEEYVFAKKTPDEQKQVVAKWAALPGTWLTAFQRRQVGYEGDDTNLTKYSNYAALVDNSMKTYALEHGIGEGTTEWDSLTARRDTYLAARANKLGVTDTVDAYEAKTYTRIGHALNLTGTPGWDQAVTWTHAVESYLNTARDGEGLSSAGNTVEAQRARLQFGNHMEELRAGDPALDAALNTIAEAVDKSNHYDLYDYLFFDKSF